jgi:hypothetical protein
MTATLRWRCINRHSRELVLDCPHGLTRITAIEPPGKTVADLTIIRLAVARHALECGCARGIDTLMSARKMARA